MQSDDTVVIGGYTLAGQTRRHVMMRYEIRTFIKLNFLHFNVKCMFIGVFRVTRT